MDGRLYVPHLRRGYLSKSVAGSSNVTLTDTETANGHLNLTGALTGAISVFVPAAFLASGHEWWVTNATTGAFALTFIGPTGTGVVITQGRRCKIASDGTNLFQASPMVNSSGVAVSDSFLSIAMSDANTTPTAAQYVHRSLTFTGTLTADRDIVLPLMAGAIFTIQNATTGGFALNVKVTGQTGFAIAAAKTAVARCHATDYERVTLDA